MNDYRCEICGRPASVHVTEIRDGRKTERHLCEDHADLPGVASSPGGEIVVNGVSCATADEAAIRGIVDNLRGAVNFTRRHGRMPVSPDEVLEGMAMADDVTPVEIADVAVQAQLKYIEGLIAFCRTHGRMPQTPDEMPPAPPV